MIFDYTEDFILDFTLGGDAGDCDQKNNPYFIPAEDALWNKNA